MQVLMMEDLSMLLAGGCQNCLAVEQHVEPISSRSKLLGMITRENSKRSDITKGICMR